MPAGLLGTFECGCGGFDTSVVVKHPTIPAGADLTTQLRRDGFGGNINKANREIPLGTMAHFFRHLRKPQRVRRRRAKRGGPPMERDFNLPLRRRHRSGSGWNDRGPHLPRTLDDDSTSYVERERQRHLDYITRL